MHHTHTHECTGYTTGDNKINNTNDTKTNQSSKYNNNSTINTTTATPPASDELSTSFESGTERSVCAVAD